MDKTRCAETAKITAAIDSPLIFAAFGSQISLICGNQRKTQSAKISG
jgi:hypothetical protein